MLDRLVFLEIDYLGAESRFFLQVMACQWAAGLGVSYKIKEAAKLHCLTERLVRGATLELVEAGLLTTKKQAEQKGRPSQEYEASQYLLDLLAKQERSTVAHQDLVLRLFNEPDVFAEWPLPDADTGSVKAARKQIRKDGRPAAPGARGRLAASTRVLLAALLNSADQCGVVTGVGEARLRAMTGLNSAALKHQVKRLLNLGFMRCHVPGVSNGVFVGAKVPSIYYLNLGHPQLTDQSPYGLLVYASEGLSGYERLTSGLHSDLKKALLALGPAVLDVLYHKLARYTSHLLSNTWGEPSSKYGAAPASLEGMIARELGQLKVGNPRLSEAGYYWPGMLDHFFALAYEWAELLKKRLSGKIWQGYQPQLVRLVPAPDEEVGVRIVSLMVYPAPAHQKNCILMKDFRNGSLEEFHGEADLVMKYGYVPGLLTPRS
ncbi:hypothetical protein DN826_15135 [Stutzerimonas nosocomialis]|uniref:hypothetical protein n=1 Tax=Stutzerimonas nosocomialis TaxID=1056496 RepID=UPI001108FEA8|nr:hypothetical protein [Stutzerimonas nosocomialis]TLX54206.1 hypothetical protein DN826_15135 [Stutzerimonas nosocomialis]